MPKKAEGLLGELHMLRQGEGLTRAKLDRCELLKAKLAGADLEDNYRLFVETFKTMPKNQKTRALQWAFGIDVPTMDLLDLRRGEASHELNRSVDQIKVYERDALNELTALIEAQLIAETRWYRLHSQAFISGTTVHVTRTFSNGKLNNEYVEEDPDQGWPVPIFIQRLRSDNPVAEFTMTAVFDKKPTRIGFSSASTLKEVTAGLSIRYRDAVLDTETGWWVASCDWQQPKPMYYSVRWEPASGV